MTYGKAHVISRASAPPPPPGAILSKVANFSVGDKSFCVGPGGQSLYSAERLSVIGIVGGLHRHV